MVMKTAEIYPEASCPKCGEKEQIIYVGKEEYKETTLYAFLCLMCVEEFETEGDNGKRKD